MGARRGEGVTRAASQHPFGPAGKLEGRGGLLLQQRTSPSVTTVRTVIAQRKGPQTQDRPPGETPNRSTVRPAQHTGVGRDGREESRQMTALPTGPSSRAPTEGTNITSPLPPPPPHQPLTDQAPPRAGNNRREGRTFRALLPSPLRKDYKSLYAPRKKHAKYGSRHALRFRSLRHPSHCRRRIGKRGGSFRKETTPSSMHCAPDAENAGWWFSGGMFQVMRESAVLKVRHRLLIRVTFFKIKHTSELLA